MLYVGVLLLLILQYLRPQEFVGLMYGDPVVFALMLVLLPFWLLTLQRKKLLRTPEELFLALFWVMCVLSYWNVQKTWMWVPAWNFGKIALICLFLVHVIDSRRKLLGVIWMIILMLLVVAAMAGTIQSGGTQGQYASVGVFDNRNDFANAMGILLPLAVAFILKGDLLAKIVGAGTALVGIIQVIATESRGGQLAALFGVYAIFYMQAKSRAGRTVMMAGGILAFLAAFSLSGRLATVTEYQEDSSAQGRLEVWAQALDMFRSHPLLGVGYNQFREHSRRDSHSTYMRAIAELGGPGLFIYMGLLFFALRDTRLAARDALHPTTRLAGLAMTGVLVDQIVAGLFQTRLYHPFVVMLIVLASSVRLVASRERVESRPVPGAATLPAGLMQQAEPWQASLGPGLITPRMVAGKDLLKIGGLAFACWFAYKFFLVMS